MNYKELNAQEFGISITVTRSGGLDGAVVVFVDTDADTLSDGPRGPMMRILLNDEPVFVGKEYEPERS